ncbi:MAG TPA: hypothetical protein VIQ31_05575, partial [Phormidium sp.]
MYWHPKYINLVNVTLLLCLAAFSQTKLYAQTNSPTRPSQVLDGNLLRDDDRTINQTQLPWVLVSNQPNQVIPLAVRNKISMFLAKEGLTPIS